jgi:hypothetical protein
LQKSRLETDRRRATVHLHGEGAASILGFALADMRNRSQGRCGPDSADGARRNPMGPVGVDSVLEAAGSSVS